MTREDMALARRTGDDMIAILEARGYAVEEVDEGPADCMVLVHSDKEHSREFFTVEEWLAYLQGVWAGSRRLRPASESEQGAS